MSKLPSKYMLADQSALQGLLLFFLLLMAHFQSPLTNFCLTDQLNLLFQGTQSQGRLILIIWTCIAVGIQVPGFGKKACFLL